MGDDLEAQWNEVRRFRHDEGRTNTNRNNRDDVVIDIPDDVEFPNPKFSRERKPSPAKASLAWEEAREKSRSFGSKGVIKPAPERASLSSSWEAEQRKPDHIVIDIPSDNEVGRNSPFQVGKKEQQRKESSLNSILEADEMDEGDEEWFARDGVKGLRTSDKGKIDRARLDIDDMV